MQKDIQELQNRTNNLEKANAELSKQVSQDNISNQNYNSQIEVYRQRIAYLEKNLNSTPSNLQGFAELQAPAVMQKVEYIQDYPFVRQQVVEEGSMINISGDKAGRGQGACRDKAAYRPPFSRMLQTQPSMWPRIRLACNFQAVMSYSV